MISSRSGRAGWRYYQVFIAALHKDRNPFLSHGWCKGYVSTPHPLQGKVALLRLSYWWRRLGLIFLNLHWCPLVTSECLNSSLCWVCPGSNGFQKGGSNHSWKVQLFLTWLHVCAREVPFSRFKNACKHPFRIKPSNSIKKEIFVQLPFKIHSTYLFIQVLNVGDLDHLELFQHIACFEGLMAQHSKCVVPGVLWVSYNRDCPTGLPFCQQWYFKVFPNVADDICSNRNRF